MGNRAVFTFDRNPNPNSPAVYVHWNGGPESILAFLEAADAFGVRDDGDPSYQLARVVQIVANYFGGTLSLGVGTLSQLDGGNCDNGLYSVSRKDGKITIRQSLHGKRWKTLDLTEVKRHPYWDGTRGETILAAVLAANKAHFEAENPPAAAA